MNPLIVAVSILAGICWSAGVVGKRAGIGDVSSERDRDMRYTVPLSLSVIYIVVSAVPPIITLVACAQEASMVVAIPEWKQRVPRVLLLGICGGLGTIFSIFALALGARMNMSSVTAIIMNAVNTAGQPLLLAIAFGGLQSFGMMSWVWMFVTVCGVFLMDPSWESWCSAIDAEERCALLENGEEQKPVAASWLSQSAAAILLAAMAGLFLDMEGIGDRLAVSNVPDGQETVWAALGQTLTCLGARDTQFHSKRDNARGFVGRETWCLCPSSRYHSLLPPRADPIGRGAPKLEKTCRFTCHRLPGARLRLFFVAQGIGGAG
eukprot:TRINITY_DN12686_c0_g1_i1.p1 TRINITY_DN12686_c0_g1~~TRINITY_DN12686_c0_g1_i1.p1  ORF type:complete len:321 (+),score=31.52 TRINITY_DN12686_c0_g1_i1:142-1104(+)